MSDAAAAMAAGDYRRAARLARPAALAGDPEARRVMKSIAVDPVALWTGALTMVIVAGYRALVS